VRKWTSLILLAILAYGGWQLFEKYRIEGWDQIRLIPRGSSNSGITARPAQTLRIATWNIQVFGTSKLQKPHVVEYMARVVRQFDVVAVQEVRSREQDVVPRFLEVVNATGRKYDYVIGPRLPRSPRASNPEQYVFLYDQETVEVDRSQLYTIDDPDDLLVREPLVAWFRARGPPPDQAFTFTLVNIHTDPDIATQEVAQLPQVYHVVLNDGRNEDDVLILGDFNTDTKGLEKLLRISGMECVITGQPTNTRGTRQYDNIVFHGPSTVEFTGRAGVLDFMREFNLTLDQALEVSDHLPVWAEFSVWEGGRPGTVAARAVSRQ
jgi:deoxyribonuclease-1-like protein